MIEWLTDISSWHWTALGIVLLAIEALGTGGFLIGAAASAFITAISMLIFPEQDWKYQLTLFSLMAVVFTVVYLKKFKTFNEETDQPNLNDRASQFVGRQFTLKNDIVNGQGKIQVGDTFWKVRCDSDLSSGTKIEVVQHDGMTLIIKAV